LVHFHLTVLGSALPISATQTSSNILATSMSQMKTPLLLGGHHIFKTCVHAFSFSNTQKLTDASFAGSLRKPAGPRNGACCTFPSAHSGLDNILAILLFELAYLVERRPRLFILHWTPSRTRTLFMFGLFLIQDDLLGPEVNRHATEPEDPSQFAHCVPGSNTCQL
jgi:hypothetical protein